MLLIDGAYISEVPKNPFENRISLSEVEALIPGVKAKVFSLLGLLDHASFAIEQSRVINDMRNTGLAPRDFYISDEDREGISDLHQR